MNEDSIVFQRSPHDKENPYAQISRALIRDESISLECRMMLIYFLSMRDDFKINVKQFWSHVKEHTGRDRIRKILLEACEAGYMKREERYVGNLRKGFVYYVSETPQEEFKKCFRCPGFQGPENQAPENQAPLRKTLISSKEDNNKEEEAKASQPPPLSLGLHVKLKKEDYEKFCEDNGKSLVDDVIESLNEKIENNETKRPKNFVLKLHQWIKNQKKWDAQRKISNPVKIDKHHGLQKDPTPIDPSRILDLR